VIGLPGGVDSPLFKILQEENVYGMQLLPGSGNSFDARWAGSGALLLWVGGWVGGWVPVSALAWHAAAADAGTPPHFLSATPAPNPGPRMPLAHKCVLLLQRQGR
jgi:hypothetical protein